MSPLSSRFDIHAQFNILIMVYIDTNINHMPGDIRKAIFNFGLYPKKKNYTVLRVLFFQCWRRDRISKIREARAKGCATVLQSC